jgi:Mrp family chromosome partitioning ATPase
MPDMEDPEAALQQLLVPVPDSTLGVVAVPAVPGSPWALEALVNRLPQLVRAARGRAEFVVIDTPALGEVSDALPLLREVDDVIVVTRPGHTERAAYVAMRDLMERLAAPVHGALVMGVAPDRPPYRSRPERRRSHEGALRTRLRGALER